MSENIESAFRFCPVYSGSSGNMLFAEGGGARILIDCGFAGSTAAKAMVEIGVPLDTIDAILVTHDHSDHTKGVGILSRRYHIPVYANEGTFRAMAPIIGKLGDGMARVFVTGCDFFIKQLNVLTFPTPHDAAESVGFTLGCGSKHVSVMTDIGRFDERLLSCAAGSDLVLLEANHDIDMLKVGPYPYPLKRRILSDHGHLSNDDCASALIKLYQTGVHRAILGHLSGENNMEALALETVRQGLRRADIPDGDFALDVAHRGKIGKMYEI